MGILADAWSLKSIWVTIAAFLIPLKWMVAYDPELESESKCAYVIAVMAILWVTEALPIPVTALLPIVLFPLVGVEIPSVISGSYLTDTSMLFLGGLIIAVALEETGLHTRISLLVMLAVGAQPIMLMLGLMVTTWFLSMWISNTAATSMMIPIISSVVNTVRSVRSKAGVEGIDNTAYEMEHQKSKQNHHKYVVNGGNSEDHEHLPEDDGQEEEVDDETPGLRPYDSPEMKRLAKGLALSVAYGANIGGIATLTGTPPNLVLKDVADKLYGGESPIQFAKWMGFAFPMSLLTMVISWGWLSLVFLRCSCFKKMDTEVKTKITQTIRDRYHKLGRISLAEAQVLAVFVLLVVLWLFRKPPNINGWGLIFGENDAGKSYVSDSTPVMLLCILLFILPAGKPRLGKKHVHGEARFTPILKWSVVAQRVPWGVIILLGGGFALAKASKSSGLSVWVGNQLESLDTLDPWVMNLLICIIVASFTEVTSNTATAQLLLPVLRDLAIGIKIHPLYLMMSTAVSCSFAFMLPVATPPNAIVFSTGYLKIWEMALVGIPMNIIAVLCLTLSINTWGESMYAFDDLPAFMFADTTMAANTTLAANTTPITP